MGDHSLSEGVFDVDEQIVQIKELLVTPKLGVEQNFVLWQELPEFSGFSILIAMVPFARSNLWIK